MPTISQLPAASEVSASDEVLISQGGIARSALVGSLLGPTQPAIKLDSLSLLGRTSIGSGGPEQIDVGVGVSISTGTLVADGRDHALFPTASSTYIDADLVICNQGSPMLMQASLLRGLFSGGKNITIDPAGVISTTAGTGSASTMVSEAAIGELQLITSISEQDLVAVSHAGSDYAISYSNFLDGLTIDGAPTAGPARGSDTIWVAQGSNVMASQTFGAIWNWIANNLSTYRTPVVEIEADTNLNATTHNGCILICSQSVTLTPIIADMGNGFKCTVINASNGDVTLGSVFISSNGILTLMPWQRATLICLSYSGGTIAFAAMPSSPSTTAVPGQPGELSISSITGSTITISWQAPSSGGVVASYIVQFRLTGATAWIGSLAVGNATSAEITGLQLATSYDIIVEAQNASGSGASSVVLTAVTAGVVQSTIPVQVSGVSATPLSSSTMQVSWMGQTDTSAATSFDVQYRLAGSSNWAFMQTGVVGTGCIISGLKSSTSYDFSVLGVNASGVSTPSAVVTATTFAATPAVNSIKWILVPSGTYMRAVGTIGVNAQVSPASSPVQFGFSLSDTTQPDNWTTAVLVNTDLWGAYLPTPATAGSWYAWAQGLDGSASTVASSPFDVQ